MKGKIKNQKNDKDFIGKSSYAKKIRAGKQMYGIQRKMSGIIQKWTVAAGGHVTEKI